MRRVIAAVLLSASSIVAPGAAAQPDPLSAHQPVVGVSFRGIHRAYPVTLFAGRRVLNDVIGSMEIAVFHDPERGVSSAWFRTVLGDPIEFSGAAIGAVADDLTTVTRWDLTTGVAVGGNLEGQRLVSLGAAATSWAGWVAAHPNATVFSAGR